MKFTYFLGVLAYGLCLEGRRIPAAGVVARQWGDGEDDDEGEEYACEWTDHCLGISSPPCPPSSRCWLTTYQVTHVKQKLTATATSPAVLGHVLIRTPSRPLSPLGSQLPSLSQPPSMSRLRQQCLPIPIANGRATARVRFPLCSLKVELYWEIWGLEINANPTLPVGDPCQTENDCDGDMTCHSGICGDGPVTLVTSTRRIVTSTRRVTVTRRPTTTRRVTVPPRTTTTRRVTVPPRPTTTRRVTVPLTSIRSTVRPQPTSAQANPRPPCADNPLSCIGM
jgi:hypothetical protein